MHVEDCLYIDDLPADCIIECSQRGPVDRFVEEWVYLLDFTVDRNNAVRCLTGYGFDEDPAEWGNGKLAEYVLWLACCDFKEWDGTEDSPRGSDIFCLEG